MKCADGQNLPYTRYVNVKKGHNIANTCTCSNCLLLITSDSRYDNIGLYS